MGKKAKTGKGRLDKYYHLAKEQGYRARSAFKLIQLTQRNDIFSKCRCLLDLCAAPGGWLQVAQKNMPVASTIIGVDLAPIKPIRGVVTIQADITTQRCRTLLKKEIPNYGCDVVLHDGAPNVGTSWSYDASQDYASLLWVFQQLFSRVVATKPSSSRDVSAEIFVICSDYKNPAKIDPKFFDPRFVFINADQGNAGKASATETKTKRGLKELVEDMNRRNRQGYNEGDDFRVASVTEFFQTTTSPAEFLVSHHKLTFPHENPTVERLKQHPLTTDELLGYCEDLKVLGKREYAILIKWRGRVLRDWSREDAAKTRENKMAEDHDSTKSDTESSESDASETTEESMQEKAWQHELEDLSRQCAKDELKEKRKRRELLKKKQLQRERSLGAFDAVEVDDELFQKSLAEKAFAEEDEVLEQAGLLNNSGNSTDEDDDNDDDNVSWEDSDVESAASDEGKETVVDPEMERLSKLAVDLDVMAEMDKQRKKASELRREMRKKKETRRQQVFAEWSRELETVAQKMQHEAERAGADVMDRSETEEDDDDDKSLAYDSDASQPKEPMSHNNEENTLVDVPNIQQHATTLRQTRWFSQPLFEAVGVGADILDVPDEALPQMPLTEKEQRRQKRQREKERQEQKERGRKLRCLGPLGVAVDEDDRKGFVEVPRGPTPAAARTGLHHDDTIDEDEDDAEDVTADVKKPDSAEELAQIQALGSFLARKRTRMDLLDGAYNRYAFDDDDAVPEWFLEEEEEFSRPELPVTKEMMRLYRQKLREISQRPIRKVQEATGRKKMRLKKRLEKVRKQVEHIADSTEHSEATKTRSIRRLMRKATRGDGAKEKSYIVSKRAGGGVAIGKKGAKGPATVVDRRLKKDKRAQKVAARRQKKRRR